MHRDGRLQDQIFSCYMAEFKWRVQARPILVITNGERRSQATPTLSISVCRRPARHVPHLFRDKERAEIDPGLRLLVEHQCPAEVWSLITALVHGGHDFVPAARWNSTLWRERADPRGKSTLSR